MRRRPGRMKRVAFVTDYYPEVHKRWSGAEIACQRLREILTKEGVEVDVFTARADMQGQKPEYVEEVRLLEDLSEVAGTSMKALVPFDPLAYRHFRRRFKALSPDIVHLHNLKFMSFAPLLAARSLGIPTVFSVYDNWALCPRYCLIDKSGGVCEDFHGLRCLKCVPVKKKPFVAFRRPVFERFLGKLDAIAVLTGSEKERYARSGVRRDLLHVLPLPIFDVNDNHDVSGPSVVRDTILFVGRLEHAKGLHVLVDAMPAVLRRFKDARVMVVGEHSGSDKYKRAVMARIQELGVGKVFTFLGKMGNKEIAQLLKRSHVVAAPEQWAIAWPIFLTEALSMGKRVVASRIGDIPEFIEDGRTGSLVAHDSPTELAGSIIEALEALDPVNHEASLRLRRLCDRRAIRDRLMGVYEAAGRQAGLARM